MLSYCLKFEKNAESTNLKVVKKIMVSSKYAVCDSQKLGFRTRK